MKADLLTEIKAFLAASGMGSTYFGQKAVKNPHLVKRLEGGKTVTLKTAERARNFIAEQRGQQ